MKKKILLALIIVSMLVCLFAISASAVSIDGIEYTLSGTSATVAESNKNTCTLKDVVIPETITSDGKTYTVTAIAVNAFQYRESIETVSIPKTITIIKGYTFRGCINLKSFNFNGAPITEIEAYTFDGCALLSSVNIPDTVKTFGQGAFYGCKALTSIELPSALTSIGGKCFQNCSGLVRVELPAGVTSIPQDGFHACSSLTYINVPRDCVSIGNYAFNGCGNLEVLDMSEAKSLKSTGSNFGGCKITSLVFPEGFETFGGYTSASKLTYISFPNSLKKLGRIQMASITEFVVPDGLTSLGGKTFDYCGSLQKVTIPKTVASIDTSNNGTFFGTTKNNLKEIIYTGNETDPVVAQIRAALPNATITFANHCDVYYGGNHAVGESEYVFSSFIESSIDQGVCTKCGQKSTLATYNPIITFVGLSAKIDGDKICMSYTIDKDSLAIYEEKTGKTLGTVKFGVTAAIVADGTAQYETLKDDLTPVNNKTIVAPASSEYAGFDFVISGFTAEHYERLLVMCAYVYDGSEVYYVDTACNTYATPFTFASLMK